MQRYLPRNFSAEIYCFEQYLQLIILLSDECKCKVYFNIYTFLTEYSSEKFLVAQFFWMFKSALFYTFLETSTQLCIQAEHHFDVLWNVNTFLCLVITRSNLNAAGALTLLTVTLIYFTSN